MDSKLIVKSLSKRVYEFLHEQLNKGTILPGSTINIVKFAKQLGISKTPLRNALIHLELEGFVTILPRRSVMVNVLTIQDVKNTYDMIGALEASIISQFFEQITDQHIAKLAQLNTAMRQQIKANNFKDYFASSLAFHNVYLDLSDNKLIKRAILPARKRLYEFPAKIYISKWEERNCQEHQQFIDCLKDKRRQEAASILRDVHWSFEMQKEYILKFHAMRREEIDQEFASRQLSQDSLSAPSFFSVGPKINQRG